jgi:HSP20 family protein
MFELEPWRKRVENAPATFRREFDDLVERFFGRERMDWLSSRSFSPAVDISETEHEILIKAELPGIDQKDLEVSLTGDALTIKGEKKEETEEKGGNVHRIERSYGSFSRSFTLPCEVKSEAVEAKFKDGVLSLKLPKCETAKKKSIAINVE